MVVEAKGRLYCYFLLCFLLSGKNEKKDIVRRQTPRLANLNGESSDVVNNDTFQMMSIPAIFHNSLVRQWCIYKAHLFTSLALLV